MKYFVIYRVTGVDNATVSEWELYEDAEKDYNSVCEDFDLEFIYIAKQEL